MSPCSPPPVGTLDAGYLALVGQRLVAARLASRRTVTDIGRALGVGRGVIRGIERGRLGRNGAAFRHYLAYAAHLDLELAATSAPAAAPPAPAPGERLTPRLLADMAGVPRAEREAALIRVVAGAIAELRAARRPVTRAALGRHLGMSPGSLVEYPGVRAVFAAEFGRQRDERAGAVVEQVRRRLAALADGGRGLTRDELAAACGLSRSTIARYSAALALLPPPARRRGPSGPRRETVGTVPWRESVDELHTLHAAAGDATSRKRLHALWLVRCGVSVREAAARSEVSRATLNNWLGWYRAGGLDAVVRRIPAQHASRGVLRPDPAVRRALVEWARAGAFCDYPDACAWLWREHGVVGTYQGVSRLLGRLGVRLSDAASD